jgi:hypothetical protein
LRRNLVDGTRQSETYESRLMKYARRGYAIAVPELDLRQMLKELAPELRTAGRTYQPLTGANLLLAHVVSTATKNKELAHMYKIVKSDYSMERRAIYALGHAARRAERRGLPPPEASFVCDTKIGKVLHDNKARIKWMHWNFVLPTTLPRDIVFIKSKPHVQERADILFTGSFYPKTTPF